MVMRLTRPFHVPSGTDPSSLVTQVYANIYQYEPLGYLYPDGSIGYTPAPNAKYDHYHNGVDYGLAMGTALYAPADGVVTWAGWDQTGFGNRTSINHGEVSTLHAHQSKIVVSLGQKVKQGDLIGYVGTSGNSSGPHLHWSVQRNSDSHFVSPSPYLSAPVPAPQPTDKWTTKIHAVQDIFTAVPNDPGHRQAAWHEAYDFVTKTGRL